MEYGITRERSLELLHQYLSNPNMVKHCLASEAVMRSLARHFCEDEELWGLTIPESTKRIKSKLGQDWQSLVIGPPGEAGRNLAGIFNESRAIAAKNVSCTMSRARSASRPAL